MLMTENQRNKIFFFFLQGLGYGEISSQLSISKNTVKLFCKSNNLGENVLFCKGCGEAFEKNTIGRPAHFCSVKRYKKWWVNTHQRTVYEKECPVCYQLFRAVSKKSQIYCSTGCYHLSRRAGMKHE